MRLAGGWGNICCRRVTERERERIGDEGASCRNKRRGECLLQEGSQGEDEDEEDEIMRSSV